MTEIKSPPSRATTGTARPQPTLTGRATLIALSVLAGAAVAVLWSAQLVDDDIGVNSANSLLGQNVSASTITGTVTGLVFALVTGLAGTFTACNIAVFSAVAPMVGDRAGGHRFARALRPLGWLTLGAVLVAGVYGAIGVLLGSRLPQLSTARIDGHVPVSVLQSITVFGLIGIAMLYLGLAAVRVVPDPLARLTARWSPAPQFVMGLLIGGFLIGRPWPLFKKMFEHAATTHSPLFGSATFILIVLGNSIIMGLLFLIISSTPLPRWLRAKPGRVERATAAALVIGGTFTLLYWGVRVPANLGFGWFPTMPWH